MKNNGIRRFFQQKKRLAALVTAAELLICTTASGFIMNGIHPEKVYADQVELENLCVGAGVIGLEDSGDAAGSLGKQTVSSESAAPGYEIRIRSAEDLLNLSEHAGLDSHTSGKTFVLTADIDMTGVSFNTIPSFFGTFEGNGHTISGLKYGENGEVQGFFRYIRQGAAVKNLNVKAEAGGGDNGEITGGICGINEGILSNCTFNGSVKGKNITGGIAAINEASGTIVECTNHAGIEGYYFTGGVTGKNYGVAAYSSNFGDINHTVEWVEKADAEDPASDTLSDVLAGGVHLKNEVSVKKKGNVDTGGIAGYSMGGLHQCANYGDVGYGSTGYNIGGIAGRQAGFISYCTNEGTVYGRKDVGGIVGQMEPYLTMADLETLPEAVDKLHDLTESALQDADSTAGVISEDIRNLSAFARGAVTAGDQLAAVGENYLNQAANTANSLQARVDYLSESMPKLFDYLGEANDSLSDASDYLNKLLKDTNLSNRLSDYPELEEDLKELKEMAKNKNWSGLKDRVDDIRLIISTGVIESLDGAKSIPKNRKKLHKSMDHLSDTLEEGINYSAEVVDHLNGMEKAYMPYLGEDFDYSREVLRAHLDAMSETLNIMASHSDSSSEKLTGALIDVNDQMNVVFHILSDELDRIGDISRGETDELVTDVSDEEIGNIEQGRVDHCSNQGQVEGDIDVGGIAGAMAIDTDDPEENAAGSMDGGFTDKYLLRSVILNCKNDERIRSKKDGAGGIVGYMGHGVVSGCESYGSVTSAEGGYVGGIAGQSYSIVKNSCSMPYLDGESCVGGIAGFGTTITGCTSIPVLDTGTERGSIAGRIDRDGETQVQHLETVTGNRFVNETVGGIDNFSMAGHAEPVSYEEAVSANTVPEGFRELRVIFIVDDEVVGVSKYPCGTSLLSVSLPTAAGEDEYVSWENIDKGKRLTGPAVIRGEKKELQKTLVSDEVYPGTQMNAALVSGRFTEYDSLSAEVRPIDETTVEYEVDFNGIRSDGVQALRLYAPFEKYELYGIDGSGNEHRIECEVRGSYAAMEGGMEYTQFRMKQKKDFWDRLPLPK